MWGIAPAPNIRSEVSLFIRLRYQPLIGESSANVSGSCQRRRVAAAVGFCELALDSTDLVENVTGLNGLCAERLVPLRF